MAPLSSKVAVCTFSQIWKETRGLHGCGFSAEDPLSEDRACSLTGIFTWCSQLFLTFSAHTGFHVGNGPHSSVSLSQRIMSHHSTLPKAQMLGAETDPRSQGTAAAGLWRRAMAQAYHCMFASHVLAIPTLHADWGFIFPMSQLSTVLMAQREARKACNLNHKHLDISLQNESVPEAYAREWDSPFGWL